ncbi:prolyl oligopeptidase family serine peptidase [Chitinibacter sp. SCUT-21]|uniref:prolyl oligopeptidase family serine peptidase n=1 Tax=Chitinibacter sp. SCUT-21 TaxID=2970891 RepID=UPI0035A7305F
MALTSHDPYLWLEDSTSAQTCAWVTAQNKKTQLQLDADPRFAPLSQDILNNIQNSAQIPLFSVHDGVLYNFFQNQQHPRGVYRSTTLDSYRQAATEWQVLLDLDALAEAEQVDWYLSGVEHCTLMPSRCLLSLSIGGGDRCVIREYDLQQRQFVAAGFEFPYSKSQVSWRDPDSVFVCPAWDEDQITEVGYSAEVVLYRRGQAWGDAASMIVLPANILKASAWRFLDGDGTAFDVIEAAQDFYRRSYFLLDARLGEAAEPIHLRLPLRCTLEAYTHGDLIIKIDVDWVYRQADQQQDFKAGSLLAIACDAHTGELGRSQLLFAPTATQSVQMLEANLNGLFVLALDNVTSRVLTFEHCHGAWQPSSNTLPRDGVIDFVAQPWQSDELFYLFHHFLQPAQLCRTTLGNHQTSELLRSQPPAFCADTLQVQQFFAKSKDGTQVPYFMVASKDIALDGNTPCLLYGYGGFAVPLLPNYLDNLGQHWLQQGCAYIVANVRGGGEFGPSWHEAARGERRQNSFDDFIAVAEDLIARGVTRPQKLAIQGGSNGGLLVAASMLQRPELFAAVVCEVPLLDMLRYHELGAGASWMAEYGDPVKHADILGVYSPYHNIKTASEQHYPSVLLTTAANDDRVHPAHARKMAAKLANAGHVVWFCESQVGGHMGQTSQQEIAQDLARALVFLYQQLSVEI